MSGCQDVRMSGCQDVRMSGCQIVWMSSCQIVWMSCCQCSLDVELMDFLDFRNGDTTLGHFWVDSRDAIASKNADMICS